jgi:hypothetical protein
MPRTLSVIAMSLFDDPREGSPGQFRIGTTQCGGTAREERTANCRYTRYAQMEPVVSNTRQKNSGVHVISTAPPSSPSVLPRRVRPEGNDTRVAVRKPTLV